MIYVVLGFGPLIASEQDYNANTWVGIIHMT